MEEDSSGPVDLFGDPLRPYRDARGRKPHRRIAQIAEKVAVLKATGSTDEQVAERIGLSIPTLKKYYLRELTQGAARARQVLIERMWEKALDGSVPAAKLLREEFRAGSAQAFDQAQRRERRSRATPALGKKDQQRLDAAGAGEDSDWGDDLKAPTVN